MGFACPICSDGLEKTVEWPPGDQTPVPRINTNVSSTPCGHVFHTYCLRRWMHSGVNSAQCPNCRKQNTTKTSLPIFLNMSEGDSFTDGVDPEQFKQSEDRRKELEAIIKEKDGLYELLSTDCVSMNSKLIKEKAKVEALSFKCESFQSLKTVVDSKEKEIVRYKKDLEKYKFVEQMVLRVQEEDDANGEEETIPSLIDIDTHVLVNSMLKAELKQTMEKLQYESIEKDLLRRSLLEAKKDIKEFKTNYEELNAVNIDLKARMDALTARRPKANVERPIASTSSSQAVGVGKKVASKARVEHFHFSPPKRKRAEVDTNLNTTIDISESPPEVPRLKLKRSYPLSSLYLPPRPKKQPLLLPPRTKSQPDDEVIEFSSVEAAGGGQPSASPSPLAVRIVTNIPGMEPMMTPTARIARPHPDKKNMNIKRKK